MSRVCQEKKSNMDIFLRTSLNERSHNAWVKPLLRARPPKLKLTFPNVARALKSRLSTLYYNALALAFLFCSRHVPIKPKLAPHLLHIASQAWVSWIPSSCGQRDCWISGRIIMTYIITNPHINNSHTGAKTIHHDQLSFPMSFNEMMTMYNNPKKPTPDTFFVFDIPCPPLTYNAQLEPL